MKRKGGLRSVQGCSSRSSRGCGCGGVCSGVRRKKGKRMDEIKMKGMGSV